MSNNGKIIYGGEAFEQNRDPSPGLGMGEIRYFTNPPDDPRWLRCDGNIHKRSSYPAYAATRPLPAWRFEMVNSSTTQTFIVAYTPDRCAYKISDTEILYVSSGFVSNSYISGMFLYNCITGNILIIHDNSTDEPPISLYGSFYSSNGTIRYITEEFIWVINTEDGISVQNIPSIDTASSMNNAILPYSILTSPRGHDTIIFDGNNNLWVSNDGENFVSVANIEHAPFPRLLNYAVINILNDYKILFSGKDERIYLLDFYNGESLIFDKDDGVQSSITPNMLPIGKPMRIEDKYVSSFRDNTLVEVDVTNRTRKYPKYITSNLDSKITVPMFNIEGNILFSDNLPRAYEHGFSQFGFLQPDSKCVERIDLQSHRDILANDRLVDYVNNYSMYSDHHGGELYKSFTEDGSHYLFPLYVESSNNDSEFYLKINRDETMFHAPGLRLTDINGASPYVWTGAD